MNQNLKKYFAKSFFVLFVTHLGYFLYGYFTFLGIKKINWYDGFYRFKFYDDVSISHFFVSSLFLFFFLFFLVKNHFKKHYTSKTLSKIIFLLLLISFLNFSFFISYSSGLNAKLRKELPENAFNKDKELLNVLNPFFYSHYLRNGVNLSSDLFDESLYNVTNILYPKPYPVIEVTDSVLTYNQNYSYQTSYYSIDTLKILTETYIKISTKTDTLFDIIGFDKKELDERIIRKKIIKDSTEILYKGERVNPYYDKNICVFMEYNNLFNPARNGTSIEKQKYDAAVKLYKLLYKYNQDSLLNNIKRLDTLVKKYNVNTYINPKEFTSDVFYFKNHPDEVLDIPECYFDRKQLNENFTTLDSLFYESSYLDASIRKMFFIVVFSVFFILCLIFTLLNNKTKNKLSKEN